MAMCNAPRVKSILRNRNFLLLWLAYFISAAGDHLSELAILKTQHALADEVNVTPMQARMAMLFFIPFFLFGPLMGYLADRFSRRRLMVAADVVRLGLMLMMAGMIARGQLLSPTWGPYLPLLAVGVFAAMFSPARSALLPTLIETNQLVQANALLRFVGVLATIVSALVGGYLADSYAPSVSFDVDAMTFAVSAVCVMGIIVRRRPPAPRAGGPMLAGLAGGFRYAARHRRVRHIFAVGAVFWFCAITVRSATPAIVKDVYELHSYRAISVFMAIMAVGMVVGAVGLAIVRDAIRSEIAITWSLILACIFAAVLALSALAPVPVGVAYVMGGIGVWGMGMFGATLMASYNALLQRIVPDAYLGRVFGVLDVCTIGGLLLATGLLGVPHWPNLDRWVGYIILGVSLLLLVTGIGTLVARLRTGDVSLLTGFLLNLNEILCRFWYRMQRVGPCTLPRTGPVVVVARHTATPDPLLITAACRYRTMSFLIAREYADIPVVRWFVRRVGCIPVKRDGTDRAGTLKAIRRLRGGGAIGMFIEGRIAPPGEAAEIKQGAALLAIKSRAVVIPVHITGTVYRDGIVAGFLARHRARVRFGRPVDLSGLPAGPTREQLAEASDRIAAAIDALSPKKVSG